MVFYQKINKKCFITYLVDILNVFILLFYQVAINKAIGYYRAK